MELKPNTKYSDGFGAVHSIVGPTRVNPAWYWSLGGFWFEQATGNHVSYRKTVVDGKESGEHYVLPPGLRSLQREVGTFEL